MRAALQAGFSREPPDGKIMTVLRIKPSKELPPRCATSGASRLLAVAVIVDLVFKAPAGAEEYNGCHSVRGTNH